MGVLFAIRKALQESMILPLDSLGAVMMLHIIANNYLKCTTAYIRCLRAASTQCVRQLGVNGILSLKRRFSPEPKRNKIPSPPTVHTPINVMWHKRDGMGRSLGRLHNGCWTNQTVGLLLASGGRDCLKWSLITPPSSRWIILYAAVEAMRPVHARRASRCYLDSWCWVGPPSCLFARGSDMTAGEEIGSITDYLTDSFHRLDLRLELSQSAIREK